MRRNILSDYFLLTPQTQEILSVLFVFMEVNNWIFLPHPFIFFFTISSKYLKHLSSLDSSSAKAMEDGEVKNELSGVYSFKSFFQSQSSNPSKVKSRDVGSMCITSLGIVSNRQ